MVGGGRVFHILCACILVWMSWWFTLHPPTVRTLQQLSKELRMELLKHLGVFGWRKNLPDFGPKSSCWLRPVLHWPKGGRRKDLVGKPMEKMVVDVDLHLERQTIFEEIWNSNFCLAETLNSYLVGLYINWQVFSNVLCDQSSLLEQIKIRSDSTWQPPWNSTPKKTKPPTIGGRSFDKNSHDKSPGARDRGTWSFPVSKLPDLQGNPRGRKAVVDYSEIDKAFSVPRLIWKLGLFCKRLLFSPFFFFFFRNFV